MTKNKITFSADDFGSHPKIDQGILELAKRGIVGATSILITAPHFSSSNLRHAQDAGLSIGLHLAFTDTKPVLRDLFAEPWVKADGTFIRHWKELIPPLLTRRVPVDSLIKEWSAQAEKLMDLSGRIDFVDSHQNLALLPQFAPHLLYIQKKFQIPKTRLIVDPLRIAAPFLSTMSLIGRSQLKNSATIPTYGLFDSGDLSLRSLLSLLQTAKNRERAFAVAVHPGLCNIGEDLGLNYSLSWRQEFDALNSPELKNWLIKNKVEVGPFH